MHNCSVPLTAWEKSRDVWADLCRLAGRSVRLRAGGRGRTGWRLRPFRQLAGRIPRPHRSSRGSGAKRSFMPRVDPNERRRPYSAASIAVMLRRGYPCFPSRPREDFRADQNRKRCKKRYHAKKLSPASSLAIEYRCVRTVGLWAMDCDFVLHSQPPVSPSLANTSALRTATIEKGVPAMLFSVSVVTLQLVFTFAMSRTEASVSPPAAVPHITGADT